MLTRKHFNALAAIIHDARGDPECGNIVWPGTCEEMRQQIAGELLRYCATQNDNFDADRFRDACSL